MRRGFGIAGLLVTAILLVIVGVIAYNVGWSDGVGTHLPAAAANGAVAPPYYYGYGFHGFGFGLFGIFWFVLIVFGLFWLLPIASWGRRWGGGWGSGRGMHGYGPEFDRFEERAQEWHRRQHGETPQPPSAGSGTTPPPPPPDSRSV